jgi:hypothetical protein
VTLATDQRQPSLFDGTKHPRAPRGIGPQQDTASANRGRRPAFDGVTYDEAADSARLGRQFAVVFAYMASGEWRTPAEIEAATGANWASAGARLRDARKPRWGGHEVQRRRREPAGAGLFEYRLVVNAEK